MPEVTMPQLGESVSEGTILRWLKQTGDAVALDEGLCEIETEKVTDELPSPFEGTMGEIQVAEGETVDVGTVLCEVLTEESAGPRDPESFDVPKRAENGGGSRWSGGPMAIHEEDDAPRPRTPAARRAATQEQEQGAEPQEQPERPVREPVAPSASTPPANGKPDDRSRFYSPVVARLAREHDIDLETVSGSGVGGRVTRKDIEALVGGDTTTRRPPVEAPDSAEPTTARPAAPAERDGAGGAGYEVVRLSATRKTIGERMARSNAEAPQAWTMVEADVSGLVAERARERERFRDENGVDLTLLPYFVATVIEALRVHTGLNARWEGDELRRYRAVNAGIAVAAETGLVVPVIHDAGDLSVEGLAKQISELAERARTRKLTMADIEGGTITINNTGAFGSIISKPIVNYPEVAIVSMERVVKRPVVLPRKDGDAIAIRSMVNVCLSFDHRALDGHEAGAFLAAVKEGLEAYGE